MLLGISDSGVAGPYVLDIYFVSTIAGLVEGHSMMISISALAIAVGLIGVALIYWSKVLSQKYNAWTTRLRSKSKFLSPPPTPKLAELNFRIMFSLFRLCGAALIAIAVWAAMAFFR